MSGFSRSWACQSWAGAGKPSLPRRQGVQTSAISPIAMSDLRGVTSTDVLVIEDESGGTLSLLQTGDLRRAARVRLGPIDPEQGKSRRVDLRPIAR